MQDALGLKKYLARERVSSSLGVWHKAEAAPRQQSHVALAGRRQAGGVAASDSPTVRGPFAEGPALSAPAPAPLGHRVVPGAGQLPLLLRTPHTGMDVVGWTWSLGAGAGSSRSLPGLQLWPRL